MKQNKNWMVQRRHLDNEKSRIWTQVVCTHEQEEAERLYRRLATYIQCHEMRLISPYGSVLLYCRDSSYFERPKRICDKILAERERLNRMAQRRRAPVKLTT